MKQVLLDVSDLPAPEPFDEIMKALAVLEQDQYLKVTHRKQPILLYKPLQDLGFNFHVQTGQSRAFEIFIWAGNQNPPPGIVFPNLADLNNSTPECGDC